MMSIKRHSSDLVQPYEMETKDRYINRFATHREMTATFNESTMCREIAEQIWRDRLQDASVTVRLLNGDEYFLY